LIAAIIDWLSCEAASRKLEAVNNTVIPKRFNIIFAALIWFDISYVSATCKWDPMKRRRRSAYGPGDSAPSEPITGTGRCCPRAASGNAAAPAGLAMNSRRFIRIKAIASMVGND
jgi:hypothetical protein